MKIKKINQSAGVIANVVNDLNSDSEIDALSAAAGKELNNKINNIVSQDSSASLILNENIKIVNQEANIEKRISDVGLSGSIWGVYSLESDWTPSALATVETIPFTHKWGCTEGNVVSVDEQGIFTIKSKKNVGGAILISLALQSNTLSPLDDWAQVYACRHPNSNGSATSERQFYNVGAPYLTHGEAKVLSGTMFFLIPMATEETRFSIQFYDGKNTLHTFNKTNSYIGNNYISFILV